MPEIKIVKIYGGSDDLIEIESVKGKVRGCDEYNGDIGYAEFSSGDVNQLCKHCGGDVDMKRRRRTEQPKACKREGGE